MNYFGLLLLFHVASSGQHSLRYFLTATYGVPGFPEFIVAATVDEVQVGYCDSNIKTVKPRQDWMRRLMEKDPEHLEWYSQQCREEQYVFRLNNDNFKQRLNLTKESSPEIPVAAVAGGVAAFLLGVAVIIAVFCLRKRNGFKQVDGED